jgi:hypothetical protein
MMHAHNEVPTAESLDDLVARCRQLDRYHTQLTSAEETRISAIASALVSMRRVLELEPIPAERLPAHHRRAEHWALVSSATDEALTEPVRSMEGLLALDEHGQVKILSDRSWRGRWRGVNLWKDGADGLSAAALLEFLAALAALAQTRAPGAAEELRDRRERLVTARELGPTGPRMSGPQVRARR